MRTEASVQQPAKICFLPTAMGVSLDVDRSQMSFDMITVLRRDLKTEDSAKQC